MARPNLEQVLRLFRNATHEVWMPREVVEKRKFVYYKSRYGGIIGVFPREGCVVVGAGGVLPKDVRERLESAENVFRLTSAMKAFWAARSYGFKSVGVITQKDALDILDLVPVFSRKQREHEGEFSAAIRRIAEFFNVSVAKVGDKYFFVET